MDIIKIVLFFIGIVFLSVVTFTSSDGLEELREIVRSVLTIIGLVALIKWGSEWIKSE